MIKLIRILIKYYSIIYIYNNAFKKVNNLLKYIIIHYLNNRNDQLMDKKNKYENFILE